MSASSVSSISSSETNNHSSAGENGALSKKFEPQGISSGKPAPKNEKQGDDGLERQQTNSSNVTIIPILKRRGLLSRVCLLPEYKDARTYPKAYKNFLVFITASAALIGPMGTNIVLPVINDITEKLDTTETIVNISVGIYLLALGIFPIWWSSISERIGRRSVYVVSFALFFCFSIGSALTPNINGLIAFRFLMGVSSSSVQSVGSGTISDLYEIRHRGQAMGYFYLGVLVAPFIAPIVGGAIGIKWGFRGTSWFLVIVAGVVLVFIIFGFPETLRKQDNSKNIAIALAKLNNSTRKYNLQKKLEKQSKQGHSKEDNVEQIHDNTLVPEITEEEVNTELRRLELVKTITETDTDKSVKHIIYLYLVKPTRSVIFLKYPPVLFMIIYSAVSFGCLYFVNLAVSYQYSRSPYNFSSIIVGLCYIPNSFSYIITSIFSGPQIDRMLQKFEKKHGFLAPESRISYNCYVPAVILPISLLIMGWCWQKDKVEGHWPAPMVGQFLWGAASTLVINATVTYIVDTLPGKGATGVALNNLIRQIFATIACFVIEPLIRALGVGVLFSILAGILFVSGICFIIVKRYSSIWREKYNLNDFYDFVDM